MNESLMSVSYNNHKLTQLEPRFDEEYGVYWALMNPRAGSFNPQFLGEVRLY